MSHLLDDDEDLPRRRAERELTLSTGAILGIFFGLALLCAFFFGFGYNMGHKSSTVAAAMSTDSADNYASTSAALNSSKPAAGSPLGQLVDSGTKSTDAGEANIMGTPPHATSSTRSSAGISPQAMAATPLQANDNANTNTASAPVVRTPASVPTAAAVAGGTFVVQVAAVSHQEDAELLVSALQRKGYSVAARNEPGDKLVHIQVGPFSDHKDADAMKQRLQGDGYNAMIKQL